MDLATMSSAELRDLKEKVEAQLIKREKLDREQAVESIYSIAHSLGVPLEVLLKDTKQSRAPSKLPPKMYRDPANPENRWIGRGPRPEWLKEAIKSGKTLESFLVES